MKNGLGQNLFIWTGRTPGVLHMCRKVEMRLVWMATRLPPTPVRREGMACSDLWLLALTVHCFLWDGVVGWHSVYYLLFPCHSDLLCTQ